VRSARVMWAGAALFGLCASAACTGSNSGPEPLGAGDYVPWDSLGIRMVESPSEVLETALPWVVGTEPDLQLGHVEGDRPFLFQDIGGIATLPDGGILVVDGGSHELRWFDASGEHIRTTGGPGQGPGQFFMPRLVPQFQADSLLIFNRVQRTFTWVAMDGSAERRFRGPEGNLLAGGPLAASGSKVLVGSVVSASTACPVLNEPCGIPHIVHWTDVTDATADTLAVYSARSALVGEPGTPPVLFMGPFEQMGLAAVGSHGPVVEGDPEFELRQFDSEGRLVAIFRVDAGTRVTPLEALDRHVQQSSDPAEMRRIYLLMGLPEVLPAFQALRVDDLGWYWAQMFKWSGEKSEWSEWLVLDPEGQARGIVELPSDLEVHAIGETYIIGRWIDDLRVEYVRRYALDRRGS
jgi:hypothetical protein